MENKMMTKRERKLRGFESLQIALATEDAKRMPTTPEIQRQVESLYAAGRRQMAESRQRENVLWPVQTASDEIRPAILAMPIAVVEQQLGMLRVKYPGMHGLFRDRETLSDHDLRAMLEDATRLTEDKE
jgi:hypothetical protein